MYRRFLSLAKLASHYYKTKLIIFIGACGKRDYRVALLNVDRHIVKGAEPALLYKLHKLLLRRKVGLTIVEYLTVLFKRVRYKYGEYEVI